MIESRSDRGFTLIELLVVVAIIGVLAAVGVLAFQGFLKNSKEVCAKSNHKNMVNFTRVTLNNCSINPTITLLDRNGEDVVRDCSQPGSQWDGYMRDHFVGSGFRSCDGSDTAIPIGRAHHTYPPVGQTYYSTDNVANWPFYITTCFAEEDCKRDIVYWTP